MYEFSFFCLAHCIWFIYVVPKVVCVFSLLSSIPLCAPIIMVVVVVMCVCVCVCMRMDFVLIAQAGPFKNEKTYIYLFYICTCHAIHVEVIGQLVGSGSLLCILYDQGSSNLQFWGMT